MNEREKIKEFPCPECDGSGKCPVCDGHKKDAYRPDFLCSYCRGCGECDSCEGTGHEVIFKKVEAK